MLNWEKYRNEILDKAENSILSIEYIIAKDYIYKNKTVPVYIDNLNEQKAFIFDWLISECKEPEMKISSIEYNILNYLKEQQYNYLVRDKDNILYTYQSLPIKRFFYWTKQDNKSAYSIGPMFNDLFQFIKWEDKEPTKIQDVLNSYEIMED